MQLKIEIEVVNGQLVVRWPVGYDMHTLKALEAATQVVENALLQKEKQLAVEATTETELARKLLNGRR